MVKKTFTRTEIVHNGIIRIRLCLDRYKAGNLYMRKKAYCVAGDLFCLSIISFDKYILLMDIIEKKFGIK